MHFTSATIAALASIASIATAAPLVPIPRQSSQQNAIQNSITQWLSDINTVNNFVNNFLTLADPATEAMTVLQVAQDEPTQLNFLASVLTDQAGMDDVMILKNNFGIVVDALTAITLSRNAPYIVQANVNVLNDIRCGVVLGNIGGVWNSALADNGLPTTNTPPRPNVCA